MVSEWYEVVYAADSKMSCLSQSPIVSHFIVITLAILSLLTSSGRASDAGSENVATYDYVTQLPDGVHGRNESSSKHANASHGVHVVHLQFSYVERPLILTLFLLAVVLIKIGQSCSVHDFTCIITVCGICRITINLQLLVIKDFIMPQMCCYTTL